ncbi:hypothetical protein GONAM_29_00200 [Gordonia namibiensis NBRC 108229]|uniref:Uncharacterized protein n=2 Tax=Gordoniaceae TaxID=85026 RepID=K6WQ74_9ACTN|nr:hypothetical protein GONAM_29_00200 [Gordonia namibiensis NBRC 108229]
MTGDRDDNGKPSMSSSDDAAARRAARRAKLDSVFGDDLPEITKDECGEDHKGHSQDWFEAQRPPHYE